MYYLIYKITNNVNNKIYIGKHQTENKDDDYMGSGKIIKRAIEEYCEEKLNNKSYISQIFSIRKMIKDFTFDILQAIVEEVNRYNETPLDVVKMLNVTPESLYAKYTVSIKPLKNQRIIKFEKSLWVNPLSSEEESVWIYRAKTSNEDDNKYVVEDEDIKICELSCETDDDEDNNVKTVTDYFPVSLLTMVSSNKNTYVYQNEEYQVTLTKKIIDTDDMWKYAF